METLSQSQNESKLMGTDNVGVKSTYKHVLFGNSASIPPYLNGNLNKIIIIIHYYFTSMGNAIESKEEKNIQIHGKSVIYLKH